MADPFFVIESEGGVVFSNEIQSEGIGVEITSRFTGGGLPPVSAQFDEGLGDGGTYRGSRALPRVIDFNAHIYGPTRNELRSILDRISMVLAHPCTVTFVDPDENETWAVTAVRTGGGDYNYGEDGDAGYTFVNIDWSMQSESPYWSATQRTDVVNTELTELTTMNHGTVPVRAVWRVTGPTNGFIITDTTIVGGGEEFPSMRFGGFVAEGETIIIDGENGTVTDDSGANRFNEFTSPRILTVPPGDCTFAFTHDQKSAEFEEQLVRTNHVINPSLRVSISGTPWTVPGSYPGWNTTDQAIRMRRTNESTAFRPPVTYDLSGLTVGKNYQVRIAFDQWLGPTGLTPVTNGSLKVQDSVTSAVVASRTLEPSVGSGGNYIVKRSFVLAFTATNSAMQVRIQPVAKSKASSSTIEYYEGQQDASGGYPLLTEMCVSEPGSAYFDGDTSDVGNVVYAWTGTAQTSKSTETTTYTVEVPVEGAGLNCEVDYSPKRWLVI